MTVAEPSPASTGSGYQLEGTPAGGVLVRHAVPLLDR